MAKISADEYFLCVGYTLCKKYTHKHSAVVSVGVLIRSLSFEWMGLISPANILDSIIIYQIDLHENDNHSYGI